MHNTAGESPVLMSSVDAAWLHMERRTNQMTINGVIYLDKEPDFDRLLNVFKERLLIYDRFRQKIVYNGDFPCWITDSEFDIHNHVKRLRPDGFNQDEFISELMSREMNFDHPLWEIFVIPDTEKGTALVVKLHHTIADGIALVSVLLSLATVSPDGPYFDPSKEYPARDKNHEKGFGSGLRNLFAEAGMILRSLRKFLLMPADTVTKVKGPLQIRKKAASSAALPLDKIKKCAKEYNATINDLLLWFTSRALREYLLNHHELGCDANLRVIIPVNLRRKTDTYKLGNKFGLVFLTLPIGEEDAVMSLRSIQSQMRDIKNSREALVAYGVLNVVGRAPAAAEDLLVNFLSSKCSAVITNVPGPRRELFIAGSAMKDIMFWVPKSGKLGLGISLISYNNKVMFGLSADSGRIENPTEVIEIFEKIVREEIKRGDE